MVGHGGIEVYQPFAAKQQQYQWIGLRENLQETMVFTIK
jgi:hypothetical protein